MFQSSRKHHFDGRFADSILHVKGFTSTTNHPIWDDKIGFIMTITNPLRNEQLTEFFKRVSYNVTGQYQIYSGGFKTIKNKIRPAFRDTLCLI